MSLRIPTVHLHPVQRSASLRTRRHHDTETLFAVLEGIFAIAALAILVASIASVLALAAFRAMQSMTG